MASLNAWTREIQGQRKGTQMIIRDRKVVAGKRPLRGKGEGRAAKPDGGGGRENGS